MFRKLTVLIIIYCSCNTVIAEDYIAHEALKEVNSLRKEKGLREYVYDEGLTEGAKTVCIYRAKKRIEGHTYNDFSFLPKNVKARSAGCAAWYGNKWGSCCIYDSYKYAGAAYCRGKDGRRYMHIFCK